jgi:short-subunit dehydrogenase
MAALITGASVGIGRELAKIFAERGHDLVLVARNREQLETVAQECESKGQIKARVLAKDLSLASSPREIFDELMRENVVVDVLVNNAGVGTHGLFADIDLDADLRLLQVNIVALTAMTKLFLREMLSRGKGRIMNVASTAAFQPGPLMATYYASKAYVLSFSEAVAQEVAGRGVSVTALCPGPVETEFQKRAGIEGSRLFKSAAMNPRRVALAGYRGMMQGHRIVMPGVSNRIVSFANRLVPRRVSTFVSGKLNEIQ